MTRKSGFLFPAALASGALTALAFPKFDVSLLAWVSLIPLFYALSQSRPGQAFRYGLVSGLGFYGLLLYWVPAVPAHFGDMSVPLSLFVYLLFILFLALFWASFGFAFAKVRAAFPDGAYLAAPFLWVAFEYALTYVLTGFPWGLLGYSQYRDTPFIQLASWTGVYGISFVLVLVQSTFVLAMTRRAKAPFFAAMALLVAVHAAGALSMRSAVPGGPPFKASVIQGNTSSDIYWDAISTEETMAIFRAHMDLTRRAYDGGARLVVWPEFTVPLCFSCPGGIYRTFREELTRFVHEKGCTLLLGTNETSGPPERERYFNTALCLHPDGSSTRYAKMHLVPFGEYTPYTKVFFFIEKVTHAIGDITPGREYVLHEHAGRKFGSPICYEIIFPDLVRRFADKGADFLVTITNDGWYGRTSAPRQHFAIAVFRAVENRRFLLRAATTGVSGIIDPRGRVLAESPIMTTAVLTGDIVAVKERTFYTRHGDVLALACLTFGLIFFIMSLFKSSQGMERHARHRKIF
ncbi:MAG TPA: apolipoprotein N-acyltransferase [Acidobacteriota bacterium]|nr:apolipoprotein N-acyltransferase [Acidobacteriota bacterium]